MQPVFRPQAMASASSPEGLTAPLKVVGRSEWLALLAVATVVLVAMAWGFLGSVPTTVAGSGILLRQSGGTLAVTAEANAIVATILVEAGAEVRKGQLIATLRMTGNQDRLTGAERKLRSLKEQRDRLTAYWNKYLPDQTANIALERATTQTALLNAEDAVTAARKELDAAEKLNRDGFSTKPHLDQARQSYFDVLGRRDDLRVKLQSFDTKRLALIQQRDQALSDLDLSIVTAEDDVATAQDTLAEESMLLAPEAGRVAEITVSTGDNIAADARLMTISYGDPALSAVVYVPAAEVEWLRPGMEARVMPGTVRPEEYGTAVGTVVSVSSYPASEEAMRHQINNDTLVRDFLQSGPRLAVRIDLAADPATPSGLRWSSGQGPNTTVSEGVLASVDIKVREQPPASLIIPALRRLLGISAAAS